MWATGISAQNGEIRRALRRYKGAFLVVGGLSACLNMLVLAGSLYMMMVYDSVLPSRSLETLAALFVMLGIAYVFQAYFELQRGKILSEVGAGLDSALVAGVMQAAGDLRLAGLAGVQQETSAIRHLDAVRTFLSGSGPAVIADLPWIAFFLGILFLLHVWLGATALAGMAVLAILAWRNDQFVRLAESKLGEMTANRSLLGQEVFRHLESLVALGMRGVMLTQWQRIHSKLVEHQNRAADIARHYAGLTRTFRLFLQSAILTVGALLVIAGEASGGVIFASSVLFGRAIAPVDQAIANWRSLVAARNGWRFLDQLLSSAPPRTSAQVHLPLPKSGLTAEQVTIVPPLANRPAISQVSFSLSAGDGLAIIGPSAAGKSSLARALSGAWPLTGGALRLDGATYDQWERDRLGRGTGYLPQEVELFSGTVAQNISRFEPFAASSAIIAAAKLAGLHELIVALPDGYDTHIGAEGQSLSAGQRQRIGLARALYGDPFLVVLDEPDANLDEAGEAALQVAIAGVRARGGIVVLVTHRPKLLKHLNLVMYLRDGRVNRFGIRDQVLRAISSADARPVTA